MDGYKQLQNLELKTIRVLDLLLETRNVSETAKQLNMRQSNVSYHLSKLRQYLQDPLLVKANKGYELSPRALTIQKKLRKNLVDLHDTLFDQPFSHTTATGKFSIALDNIGSRELIPRLLKKLMSEAPGIVVEHQPWQANISQMLESGVADIAINSIPESQLGIHAYQITAAPIYMIMDKEHPLRQKSFCLKEALSQPQIQIHTDTALEKQLNRLAKKLGVQRKIQFLASSYDQLDELIPGSGYIGFCSKVSLFYMDREQMHAQKLDQLEPVPKFVFWHERWHTDPLHKYMRSLVIAECKEIARSIEKLEVNL